MNTRKSDQEAGPAGDNDTDESLRDRLASQAKSSAESIKAEAKARAESAKGNMAEQIDGVSDAVNQAAQGFRDNQQETIAHWAEGVADGIGNASKALKQKDISELLEQAEEVARRHPVAFTVGAGVLGFALARFAKSSAERRHDEGVQSVQEPPRPAPSTANSGPRS